MANADFNGDGNPDFAFPDADSGRVSILLGDGTGGFHLAAGSPIAVGQKPSAVVAGDFNGDGKPDLAVADSGDDTVSVLLGDGTGGLRPAPGLPVDVGGAPTDLTAADLDGDGRADLAMRVRVKGRVRLAILLEKGSGRFVPAAGSPLVVAGDILFPLAVADVNGDGKPDLVVSRGEASGISILPGQGAGTFGAARPAPAGREADLVAVGDFTGDGKPDIAVTNAAADGSTLLVRVRVGNGRGGFSPAAGPPIPVEGIGAVADVNGDGKLDLVVVDSSEVSVLIGNGAGGLHPAAESPFVTGTPFFGSPNPNGIFAVDLNGDGKTDIAVPGWTHDGEELTPVMQTPPTPAISPARTPQHPRDAVFSTRGTITMLAADGNRVAAAT